MTPARDEEPLGTGRDERTVVDATGPRMRAHHDCGTAVLPSRYADQGVLGQGGMGVVHAALDTDLGREVAVKVLLDPNPPAIDRARFEQEARVTGRLIHPHIPPVYERGRTPDDRPYIAMKRVRGTSLRDRLDAERAAPHDRADALSLDRRLDVLVKVGEALAYAHAHGVVHRDIKPENVMLGEFGEVQVMDWGLAHLASEPAALDGAIAGTPAYMAPEQARGEVASTDLRTDVFALGALLYELLSGAPPYSAATLTATLELAKAAAWRPIPERLRAGPRGLATPPRELVAIAHRAMAPSPDARYQSVSALLSDVRAFRAHEPVSALRDGPVARIAKWTQRHPVATLWLVFALVLGSLVALLSAARDRAEARAAHANVERDRSRDHAQVLGQTARRSLEAAARAATIDFHARWNLSKARGEPGARFFASLGQERIQGYLHAFDGLFAIHALMGDPSTAQEHCDRALLRSARGDIAGSIADYDAALAITPDLPDAHSNRGALRRGLGDVRGATDDFERALAIDPRHVEALVNRGLACHDRGDPARAIDAYDQALAIRPRYVEALTGRGTAHAELGDFARAIADFDEALAIYPEHAEALCNRGAARMGRGETELALADFDAALAQNPRDAKARYNRGTARMANGDWAAAIADLDIAIEVDPTQLDALANRGAIRKEQGDLAGAIADCDRVLATNANHWQAIAIRGRARAALGQTDEALVDLRCARRHCPVPAARDRLEAQIRELGGTPD